MTIPHFIGNYELELFWAKGIPFSVPAVMLVMLGMACPLFSDADTKSTHLDFAETRRMQYVLTQRILNS